MKGTAIRGGSDVGSKGGREEGAVSECVRKGGRAEKVGTRDSEVGRRKCAMIFEYSKHGVTLRR